VLVCGGRNYNDYETFDTEISHVCAEAYEGGWYPPVFISGAAGGADTLMIDWAARNSFECLEFPALWKTYGRRAGPMRNQQMIDEGKPGMVIAFPGGRGTADMIERARKANIPVRIIET
jgi:hypothetical protein